MKKGLWGLKKKELRKNQRKERKEFLRVKPWILDFLKERRVFLHSKELYINPSPLRTKLGA